MKIAFTTKGTKWESMIDPRFGRSEFLLLYNDEYNKFLHYDNRKISEVAHGAGPQTAQKLYNFHPDVLITGNGPGDNAATVLEKSGPIPKAVISKLRRKERLSRLAVPTAAPSSSTTNTFWCIKLFL